MSALEQKLAELQTRFIAQLPERLRALDEAFALLTQGGDSRPALEKLHLHAHKLAGAGGTFGFTVLSENAGALEQRLTGILAQPAVPDDATCAELATLVRRVRNSILESAGTRPPEPQASAPPPAGAESKLVHLVEDDDEVAEELQLHLTQCGYRVHRFASTEELLLSLTGATPSAIVLDVVLPDDPLGGTKVASLVRAAGHADVPLVCISSRTDFEARLSAVRAGVDAYLFKPLTAGTVIDQLDRLTGSGSEEPIRVMVVDDDIEVAEYCCAILESAGMETRRLSDPRQALETMAEFRPDLLLMDLYMPACTGVEVASVMRQQDAFSSIPIVFLSSERDVDVHLSALDVGGDDFVTKPFDRERLVALVTARARRARNLRLLMTRDGLTGLLNHASLMERLEIEINRLARSNGKLSLAMIDVDHFKTVNDTYGHARGDQVLKVLGRMLRARFRNTDIVGRYGGEEFVVVFPDTDPGAAMQILEEVREGFSRIRHNAGRDSFRATFSAGVSGFPEQPSKSALLESADRALYDAKEQGRNRIRLARLTVAA